MRTKDILLGCLLFGLITTIFRVNGILLGGIPTGLLCFLSLFLSTLFFAKMDIKKFEKEAQKNGKTPLEYAYAKFDSGIIEMCKSNRTDKKTLKKALRNSVKENFIKEADSNALFNLFYEK